MIERSDSIAHIDRGRNDTDVPHVVVSLLGQLKGETEERSHLLVLAKKSNLGIEFRKLVDRVACMLKDERHSGAGLVM